MTFYLIYLSLIEEYLAPDKSTVRSPELYHSMCLKGIKRLKLVRDIILILSRVNCSNCT